MPEYLLVNCWCVLKIVRPSRLSQERQAECVDALRSAYEAARTSYGLSAEACLWPLRAEAVLAGWNPDDVEAALAMLQSDNGRSAETQ